MDESIWHKPIRFTIPGIPVAKQRPRATMRRGRGGKPVAAMYTPGKTSRYEKKIAKAVHGIAPPASTLLAVSAVIVFPRPKSRPPLVPPWMWSRGEPSHSGRKDIDNVLKALLDGLNQWWDDDRYVVDIEASKRCGDVPRIDVTVWQMRDEPPK